MRNQNNFLYYRGIDRTFFILGEGAIKRVFPDWKYNSSHMEDIAGWIAAGYLAKTPLSYRLQELDNMNLSIIQKIL